MRIPGRKANSGFTLVELAIVLIIAGIMMTLGYYSWGMVVEGRKNAATLLTLNRAKACIMSAIVASNQYPSYTATRVPVANTDAVDVCLGRGFTTAGVLSTYAGVTDAWGNPIYFIEGVRSTTQGGGSLAGNCIIPDDTRDSSDPCSPSYSTSPPGPPPIMPQSGTVNGTSSFAEDRDGKNVEYVAFILASFGKSGVADNLALSTMFPAGTLSRSITATGTNPSFNRRIVDTTDALNARTIGTWGNDIYVIVTYQEILGELARARGLTGTSGL